MTRVWRITKPRHAQTAFSGAGARMYAGRWNGAGIPMVYTAEHPALAVLEMLVHLDGAAMPQYHLIPADIPDGLVEDIDAKQLPVDWRQAPAPTATRELGSEWVASQRSVALRVPSALVPGFNVLLNPLHPAFRQVVVGKEEALELDARLLRGA